MTTYKNITNGLMAELVERHDHLVVLKDLVTGEVKELADITFNRWWVVVDRPATAEAAATNNEPKATSLDTKPSETENTTTGPQDAPMELSAIISKLENLFDLLNGLYFNGSLPRPVITVQSTPGSYGRCTTKKIWRAGEDENAGQYEINIGAEHLNRPSENTAATLLHEMVHLYCGEEGLDETGQNGRYHNKLFKREAEARDLEIGYDRAIGHSPTKPTEALIEKLRAAGFELTVTFARHTPSKGKSAAQREKAHKYVCPHCGQVVRTTAELNLICGNCEVPMERTD